MNSVFIPLKISLVFQGQKAVNPDNGLECSQPPDPSHGIPGYWFTFSTALLPLGYCYTIIADLGSKKESKSGLTAKESGSF